jgi:hypothetical protein
MVNDTSDILYIVNTVYGYLTSKHYSWNGDSIFRDIVVVIVSSVICKCHMYSW